jgi:UDP-arabinose 4-epimerase
MNVLVTGGAGYIGSHVCKALKLAGINPVTVDNLVYGHEWAVKWGAFHKVDIRETEKLKQILKDEQISAVLHFAAFAYVGESIREPLKYYDNNVGGTISLLKAMRDTHVKRFVFSSSCATYGNPEALPITEETAQNPINPYGETKLIIEKLLRSLGTTGEIQSVALRYFNAAGADLDCEIGEDHNPETHLLPLALEASLPGAKPLTIFGIDYPTADGTCIRDYIHVTDLADAHVRALKYLQTTKSSFSAFNLGSECGTSIKELIAAIEKQTATKMNVVTGARRPGDPPKLVALAKRAERELGWRPENSKIENIIETALRWHTKHHWRKP